MSQAPPRPGGGGFGGLLPTLIGAGLGYLGTRASNAAAVREAQRNRDFQKEMSDTAHQREVRDMMLAGINPLLSAHGSGASTPGGATADVKDTGEGISRGVASALAVRNARAQIDLTEAQAAKVRTETYDLQTQGSSGRYEIIRNQADRGELEVDQMRQMMPVLLAKAKEEVRLAGANVEAVKARAMLDKLSSVGAFNEAEFQKYIGTMGPAGKALGSVLKALKGVK